MPLTSDKSYMRDYELSTKEIAELEKTHRSLRAKRQADRVKAVIALSKGWSAAQIADILTLSMKKPLDIISIAISKAVFKRCWMTTILEQNPSSTRIK